MLHRRMRITALSQHFLYKEKQQKYIQMSEGKNPPTDAASSPESSIFDVSSIFHTLSYLNSISSIRQTVNKSVSNLPGRINTVKYSVKTIKLKQLSTPPTNMTAHCELDVEGEWRSPSTWRRSTALERLASGGMSGIYFPSSFLTLFTLHSSPYYLLMSTWQIVYESKPCVYAL